VNVPAAVTQHKIPQIGYYSFNPTVLEWVQETSSHGLVQIAVGFKPLWEVPVMVYGSISEEFLQPSS
jgi:hypothetical protein